MVGSVRTAKSGDLGPWGSGLVLRDDGWCNTHDDGSIKNLYFLGHSPMPSIMTTLNPVISAPVLPNCYGIKIVGAGQVGARKGGGLVY